MTDDNPIEQAPPGGELPRPVVKRRRFNASLIWLVPALAALVGLSLVINNWLQAGPQITISFQSAEGLDAGKTPVKYKNVVIGRVNKIHLSGDRSHVLVNVALEKSAEGFATRDTRFWVVRPRIGLGGVSGIDTLLSGAFIGADVGDSNDYEDEFKGLELPPAVNHGAPGRSFVLHSDDLGSLDIGSPVYYRRIQVGRVASYQLDSDGKGVSLQIFVDGPNDKFVTRSSRFWNASGVDVSIGANGLKLNTQSLATVLAGGVAFQDPPGPHDSTPAPEDNAYTLFGDQTTAMAPPDGTPHYIRMRFEQSVRGLAMDAPVEFLGINIGKVVSVRLDYDEQKQRFPVLVGAVIYPQRLGAAYDKLEALAKAHGENPDLSQMIGRLVEHGLRAQARTGNLLTGQLYVALDFIPKTPKVAFDPAAKPLTIPTVPGSFDKLQEQMAGIVDKLAKVPFDSIGQNLDRSLAGLDRTLKQVNGQTLPALGDTLHGVQRTMATANEALAGDSPLQQNLGATLEQLQRMARSLRVLTDYLGGHPEALIRGRRADAKPADAKPVTTPAAMPPTQGSKP
ncbi:intermembrane transport protein PqiB [Rhodanobacter denitrificans]|uniref:Qaraquat-inducible protein B n=1 Tax=Rhodanobacter denitrificans TaxID=666685 RepID=M4NEC6_9GAMM|nr:MlaD family protein [Rhodanobacter denitrificans]AGG88287.1 qaraquat-inducible protein B [Rhodanobacter denitrificans]UJM87430.1 MlaD family protein [Rhodanobacter denitrificans]